METYAAAASPLLPFTAKAWFLNWALNFLVGSVVPALMYAAVHSVLRQTSYSTNNNYKNVLAVLELVHKRAWFSVGQKYYWQNRWVSSWYVGRWFVCRVHTTTDADTRMSLTVDVWKLKLASQPLDEAVSKTADDSVINVITRAHGAVSQFDVHTESQLCVLPCNSAKVDVAQSAAVVDGIVSAFRATDPASGRSLGQNRFVLCGKPGIGKSTVPRLVTERLKRTNDTYLYTLNPCTPGESIVKARDYAGLCTEDLCVVVIEEFDCVLDRLGKVHVGETTATAMVTDKQSWNNMMDYIAYVPNVLLIMTTNRSKEELRDLYDASLTRDGRVSAFFEMHALTAPTVDSDIDSAYSFEEDSSSLPEPKPKKRSALRRLLGRKA
jgi:hypothetical protein